MFEGKPNIFHEKEMKIFEGKQKKYLKESKNI